MIVPSLLEEPGRVDEPQAAEGYAAVLSQVVAAGRPVIVRRNGEDLAAVVPLEQLELVREILARQEVERLAAQIDWSRVPSTHRPPQSWFDDDDNPFEPEQESAS
jgi:antitoxin (DNA-binding transcriptional repressor) of toxin-antitoxin stability system